MAKKEEKMAYQVWTKAENNFWILNEFESFTECVNFLTDSGDYFTKARITKSVSSELFTN